MRKLHIFCFLITYLFANSLHGQSRYDLENKKKEVVDQINMINKLLNETEEEKKSSLNNIRIVEKRIEFRESLISNLKSEIDSYDKEILENQDLIKSLNNDLNIIRKEYEKLILVAFKNNLKYEFIYYLFASENINQAYKRLKYYKAFSDFRQEQARLIVAVEEILYKKVASLESLKDEKEELLKDKESEKIRLAHEKNSFNSQLAGLRNKEKELRQKIKKQQEIAQSLDDKIRKYIEEEAKKKNLSDMLTPEERLISKNFAQNMGRMPWPTQYGIVVSKYGEHEHPVLKGTYVRNYGIDIRTVKNSEVRAIFDGEVSKIFSILGANTTVIIRHGNFLSVYNNLNKVYVKQGQKVSVKEVIGTVYYNQDDNSSVLHMEIWKEFEKQDPELWLTKTGK